MIVRVDYADYRMRLAVDTPATARGFPPLGPNIANLAPCAEEWEKFVIYDRPILADGRNQLSDKPGFPKELKEDHVRAHPVDGDGWRGTT